MVPDPPTRFASGHNCFSVVVVLIATVCADSDLLVLDRKEFGYCLVELGGVLEHSEMTHSAL